MGFEDIQLHEPRWLPGAIDPDLVLEEESPDLVLLIEDQESLDLALSIEEEESLDLALLSSRTNSPLIWRCSSRKGSPLIWRYPQVLTCCVCHAPSYFLLQPAGAPSVVR